MNRKERRRQARLGQPATPAARPAQADPSAPGGFGAGDALAFLAGARRATVPLPPSAAAGPSPAPRPAPAPPEHDLANAVYNRTIEALRSGRTVDQLVAAVRDATDRAERVWAARRGEVEARKRPPLACAAGCAWCCYQQVAVEPAEAVAIAEHIRGLPPDRRAPIEARLADVDSRTRGLGILARARLQEPCAFLVDGQCSIYAVRPLRCRSVYSRDAAHCRWAKEHPDLYFAGRTRRDGPGPYPVEPTRIAEAALVGLYRATKESGLPWQALELVAAVRTALAAPDVSARFLAGEPVFAEAALPPRDDASAAGPADPPRAGLAKPGDSP